MQTYASIRSRPLNITGSQHSGWSVARDQRASMDGILFDFDITDDGTGQFLLVYRSTNQAYYGDTWHMTLEDAYASAEKQFGISKTEWTTS